MLIHNVSVKQASEFGVKLTLLTKIQLVLIVFDTLVEIENLLLHLDRHLKKKQKPEILNMTFAWRKLCKAQSVNHQGSVSFRPNSSVLLRTDRSIIGAVWPIHMSQYVDKVTFAKYFCHF